MPIKHAIWKVGQSPAPLAPSALATEQILEDMIVAEPKMLSSEWMLIGRQEHTGYGGRIDLLAIAPDASLVLIELKRDCTPREIVAQALDYASWVDRLTPDQIAQIYRRFSNGKDLGAAFEQRFGQPLDEDALNASHQVIIVAAGLDDSTERIIGYLNEREIPINVLFFQVFDHGTDKLISRTWMIDPEETQSNAATVPAKRGDRGPWNGEFFASFGGDGTWDEARKFGFISAGGGIWYTQTLKLLKPGDRVWVRIPKVGYVGVGKVIDTVQDGEAFTVQHEGAEQCILDVLSNGAALRTKASDPDLAERFVRVQWLDTVPADDAFNELGMFGNQNSVCKPTTASWLSTVERLKGVFKRWDGRGG
jgi:hypothetical protein